MRLIYGKYTGVRARRVLVFDTNTAAFLGGRLTAGCLTAIKSAKLTFCFVGFGCAWRRRLPGGNKKRKTDVLLYGGVGAPVGGDCLAAIIMRAPPCTRKGHPPLTRIGAKLTFCF